MLGDLISSDSGMIIDKITSTIGALRFLISEINVGGRVSDNKDILIVSSMMDAYYQDNLNKLSPTVEQQFSIPLTLEEKMDCDSVIEYVKQNWPESDIPDLFGLD